MALVFVFGSVAGASVCTSPDVKKGSVGFAELKKIEARFFSVETPMVLSRLLEVTQRLGKLANSTTALSDPQCRQSEFSQEFLKFHLKVVETTIANEFLTECTRGDEILNRKANAILKKVIQTNQSPDCTLKETAALDELDLYSLASGNQKKMISAPAELSFTDFSALTSREARMAVYRTMNRADQLSPQTVYGYQSREAKAYGDEITEQARTLKLQTNQGDKQAEDAAREKFGFDTFGDRTYNTSSHGELAKERERMLHLALVDGNRVNCLRNYLYFTQRFSFAPGAGAETHEAIKAKAEALFGKNFGDEAGTLEGHHHNLDELADDGQKALEDVKTMYGPKPLSEDDVLKMMKTYISKRGLITDHAMHSLEDQKGKIHPWNDGDVKEAHRRQEADLATEEKMSTDAENDPQAGMNAEMGFLAATKAFGGASLNFSKYVQMGAAGDEKLKEVIRAALKEQIDQTTTYARDYVVKNQSADQRKVNNQSAEDMLYSSPQVIQSVLADAPQLMGSMCEPMKLAAKHNETSDPAANLIKDASQFGGGAVILVNPYLGVPIVVGGALYKNYVYRKKSELAEKHAAISGQGDDRLNLTHRNESNEDAAMDGQQLGEISKIDLKIARSAIIDAGVTVATALVARGVIQTTTAALVQKLGGSKKVAEIISKIMESIQKSGGKVRTVEEVVAKVISVEGKTLTTSQRMAFQQGINRNIHDVLMEFSELDGKPPRVFRR